MARACTVTPVQSAALAESVPSHGVAFRKVQQELFVQSVSESCFPELGAGSFGNSNTCNSDTRCHLLGRHRRPGAGLCGHVHSSSNPRCESLRYRDGCDSGSTNEKIEAQGRGRGAVFCLQSF